MNAVGNFKLKNLSAQSPDEVFNIVDSSDRVVGSAKRSYIHKNRLMHRSVHAIILSGDSRSILLQKRSSFKDSYPLRYTTSVSGHVDRGESRETALLRETFEEVGLKASLEDFTVLGKIPACEDTGWEFASVYVLHSDGPFKFPPAEIDSLQWSSLEDFERDISENPENFTPAFIRVYKHFKQVKNSQIFNR